jgi:cytoskeletal protein RodZ
MSPIGETLRAAREEKGLSLDRVSDDTNISKRYLSALEAEDFSAFPGDPYAVGFLRNYADYLGLASDDFVATFRNMRIQEQPVPIQDLIPKRGLPLPAILGGAAALVVILVLVVALAVQGGRSGRAAAEALPKGPIEYRVDGASFEKRLYEGDTLLIKAGSDSYRVLVATINDSVILETPSGKDSLMLGEEGTLDLDKNGSPEVKVLVKDFAKKNPAKGAVIKIEYINPDEALAAASQPPQAAASAGADLSDKVPGAPTSAQPAAPAAGAAAASKSGVLFESAKTPYPFVLSVTFRGSCMFRYEADKRDRDERYYRKGDTLTVNANNSAKIWASNAQYVKVTVQATGGKSADLELGDAGEVAVKRIAWSQSDSGLYALSVSDVD